MEILRIIVLAIFATVAFILVMRNYLSMFRDMAKNRKKNTIKHDIMINQELETLKSSSVSMSKAKAFVSLMDLSYVLVHTLVNKGNNYDDKIQKNKFCKFLTPQVMKEVFGVEGKYE